MNSSTQKCLSMPSITRRAPAGKDARKSSVEDRLLLAVESLAGKGQSFTSLSIDQLAREAGVSRGTFYIHFANKSNLVAKLLDRIRDEILTSINIWYEVAEDVSRRQMDDATAGMLRVLRRHNAVLTAVGETAAYDPAIKELLAQIVKEISRRSQRTMKAVAASGKAHAEASPKMIELLVWLVYHAGLEYSRDASDAEIKRLAAVFGHIFSASMFVDGLRS